MSKTRIYVVKDKRGDRSPRLVRAVNPAAAIRHVSADTLSVEVATQDDLVELNGDARIAVETAGEDPQPNPEEWS